LLLASCGPINPPPQYHFYVHVHNDDTLPDDFEITWWFGSTVVGDVKVTVPGGQDYTFDLGYGVPDGFELDTPAWNVTWGYTDYFDCWDFNIPFPKWQNAYKTYLKK